MPHPIACSCEECSAKHRVACPPCGVTVTLTAPADRLHTVEIVCSRCMERHGRAARQEHVARIGDVATCPTCGARAVIIDTPYGLECREIL